MNFNKMPNIQELNSKLKQNVKLNEKSISINLKEENVDNWKEDIEIAVDNIPFDNIGFGSRNSMKIELALKNNKDTVSTLIIEEPENNLSYTNMAKLISKIEENKDKQIFIATHSSYIANKLDLQNIHIVHNGNVNSLQNLDDDTRNYFKKLPGFDTLRVILANKVILVEGPADDLIIQRVYKDKYNKLPINDGIDIIAVNALAFKRYCDIAILVNKNITIVTDNDGNINENTTSGIFGTYTKELPKKKLYAVGKEENITTGKATILTVINDNTIEAFDINILKLNINNNASKNILFEVTDKKLLKATGGIIQGMSGSPIIQNDYIIGAVTHVVVDDPKKGYGILITKMLEEGEN